MKVQIDSNNYLTGSYSLIGDLNNSVEMDKLPESDVIYFTAYKILSKELVEKDTTITVYYYELDETKKQQIQDKINNPDPPDTSNDWKFQYNKLQETMVTQISNIEYIALMTDIDIWNI